METRNIYLAVKMIQQDKIDMEKSKKGKSYQY